MARSENRGAGGSSTATPAPDNHVYYFEIGSGSWTGQFSFHLRNWRGFWADPIGLKYRLLTLGMVFVQKLLGPSTIVSSLRAFPEWGPNGIATNVVRITKLGITLYLLREQYVLDPDGSRLFVHSRERFGPISFLFRSKKRHPAHIHETGGAATYLKMPLLGTLWEGDYQVMQGGDAIDATLRCSWASAREIISRVGSRPLTPPRRTAPSGRRLSSLDDVIEHLQRQRDWYEAVRDPRAVFTHAYGAITRVFRDQIPRREFHDRNWVLALDIAFAAEFFRAVDAYDLGADPPGWSPVFEAERDGRTSVLEDLIFSMAAHIVHDLPLALSAAGMREPNGLSKVADFDRVNDILEDGIDGIQQTVGRRYNPFLRWLDHVGMREDEVLTNYGIRLARAAAWFNGERLSDPRTEQKTRESIARSTEAVLRRLLEPPLLSFRLLLRIGRWVSQLTRVWPGEPVL